MPINSRQKGAAFERTIAQMLFAELGIGFKRNLEQYQTQGLGDLTPDDAAFPFLLECKAYAKGTDCRTSWELQAHKAALGTGKYPCVIWKFNNHPIKCRIPMEAIAHAAGGFLVTDKTADVSLECLCMVSREIMAREAERAA